MFLFLPPGSDEAGEEDWKMLGGCPATCSATCSRFPMLMLR